MVEFVKPETANTDGLIEALHELKSDQELSLGYCTSHGFQPLFPEGDHRLLMDIIFQKRDANKIMTFHRKIDKRTTFLVARGVQPQTKLRLEGALSRLKIPLPEKN